jgi:ArsR family transcriptional regulator
MQGAATSCSQLAAKQINPQMQPSQPAVPAMDLQARAEDAAALLKALANPDRLLLLCRLVDGERSVSELGASTAIEQPSLSQQLGVLRGERLVATRRAGKQVIYRIASPAALTVLEALYGLFCDPAQASPEAKPGRAPGHSSRRSATPASKQIA